MGTVMLPWLAQQLNRLAVPAYICLMESRSKKRYKDLTWSQADAVLKHAAGASLSASAFFISTRPQHNASLHLMMSNN